MSFSIKPLEWEPVRGGGSLRANTIVGQYKVIRSGAAYFNNKLIEASRDSVTPESGTSAAQADYEARVKSALLPASGAVEADNRLPKGHVVLEQADTLDGRVSQTVVRPNGTEYERIVDVEEAYGGDDA